MKKLLLLTFIFGLGISLQNCSEESTVNLNDETLSKIDTNNDLENGVKNDVVSEFLEPQEQNTSQSIANRGSIPNDAPFGAEFKYINVTFSPGTTEAERATIRNNYHGYISHTACTETIEIWYIWYVPIDGGNGDGGGDGFDDEIGGIGIEPNTNNGNCDM